MADIQTPTTDTQSGSPWAHGIAVFAGVIMIVGGAFQAFEGLAAIVHDKQLVVLPNYIYAFDLTVWGLASPAGRPGGTGSRHLPDQGPDLGSGRRHDPRGDIGGPQLRLVAVLALVGAPDHWH